MATSPDFKRISLVCVPTADQDRAVAFYEQLGFEKRTDESFGGGSRWIEVYLPGTPTGLALTPPPPGQDIMPMVTGITLTTEDIARTHAALKALGVDVDADVMRMGGSVPPLFWFRDPSGHTLMVVERHEA